MKKTLLAVAIPTLLIANTANAYELINEEGKFVDFYGQLRTELKKVHDSDTGKAEDWKIGAGSSRAGINAKYDVNDQVNVFGLVEFGVGEGEMKNRLHYAGFESDFGKLSFGNQYVVADDVYGAEYSYFFGGSGLLYSTLSGAQHSSLVKYNYNGENFFIAAGYGLPEDDSNQELAELYAGSSVGNFNFHIGGGVNRDKAFKVGTNKTLVQKQVDTDGDGVFEPTTVEEKSDVTADIQNTYFEGTVEYNIGAALIGFTYYNQALEQKTGGDVEIDVNGYSLASTYAINSQSTVYGGVEFTDAEANTGRSEDSTNVYVGTVYHINSWSRVYAEYGYADGTTLGFTNTSADTSVKAKTVDAQSNFAVGYRVYW